VDSRIELFSEKVWMDYLNISNANGGWESLLRDYGVNTLMLSPDEQPALVRAAQESGKWNLIYKDNTVFLFERK
jgi:predicted DNA-binding transcriptional regulator YafY